MRNVRNIARGFLVLSIVAILASCAANNPSANRNKDANLSGGNNNTIRISVAPPSKDAVEIEIVQDGTAVAARAASIGASMNSSAQNIGNTPGAGPEAAAVMALAALVTPGVMNQTYKSSLKKEADKEAKNFIDYANSADLDRQLAAMLADDQLVKSLQEAVLKSPDSSLQTADTIELNHQITLSRDFTTLGLKISYSILSKSKVVKSNQILYFSKPEVETAVSDRPAYWANSAKGSALQELQNGARESVGLIESDILNPASNQNMHQAIRYENAAGKFYERGIFIKQSPPRIAYRTLRGTIKSVYGSEARP